MLNQHDRHIIFFAHTPQKRIKVCTLLMVQARCRLIQTEQKRLNAGCTNNLKLPLRTIRKGASQIVGSIQKANFIKPITCSIHGFSLGLAKRRQPEETKKGKTRGSN